MDAFRPIGDACYILVPVHGGCVCGVSNMPWVCATFIIPVRKTCDFVSHMRTIISFFIKECFVVL